jgi:hypothetical protein
MHARGLGLVVRVRWRPAMHARVLTRTQTRLQIDAHVLEHKTVLGSMDMFAELGGVRVAIEVDGPFHYAANRCVSCVCVCVGGGGGGAATEGDVH